MAISEEIRASIEAAVHDLYFVKKDENGYASIEMYADYRETNDFLLKTAYEHRKDAFEETGECAPENRLLFAMQDKITEAYDDAMWDCEIEVLHEAGIDSSDDMFEEALEYLREHYSFDPPYDHFLDQSMRINIMLGLPEEMDREFVLIHEFYHAISAPDELTDPQQSYEQPNALVWLLEQQGYTKKQLKDTIHSWNKFFYDEAGYCKDFNKEWGGLEKGIDEFSKNHSSFLSSICQELENHSYYMGTLTILAEVTMKEFAEMMQPYKKITFHKDAMVGIFNPWNGSGSVLEIELDKPLTVPSSMIYDVQVEGVKPSYSYLLDDVYGLIGSAWKAPLSIEKA